MSSISLNTVDSIKEHAMKAPRNDIPLPPGPGAQIVSNERALQWTANFVTFDAWIALASSLTFHLWPHGFAGCQ